MLRATPKFHPARTLEEYKAQMVLVPQGAFISGSKDPRDVYYHDALPMTEVVVPEYRIGKTPVTVSIWEAFCAETDYPIPPIMRINGGLLQKDHPIVNVSWEDVQAFLGWAGLSLPTDREWEKAARGTDRRLYPWGWRFSTKRLNCTKPLLGNNGTTPVGSFPSGASLYGVLDLSGNVWEWCEDWFTTHYRSLPDTFLKEINESWDLDETVTQDSTDAEDCLYHRLRIPLSDREVREGHDRLVRGGSFLSGNSWKYQAIVREGRHPKTRNYDLSFRCVER